MEFFWIHKRKNKSSFKLSREKKREKHFVNLFSFALSSRYNTILKQEGRYKSRDIRPMERRRKLFRTLVSGIFYKVFLSDFKKFFLSNATHLREKNAKSFTCLL
jgi:hypothetical protein